MGDLVASNGSLPDLPSFTWLEKLAEDLAAVRLAVIEDEGPMPVLIQRVDQLIAGTGPLQGALAAQAGPAPIVLVATYLGLLLKAYPNSGSQDARIFGRLLRDDVHSIGAPEAAIEIACRRWRQKSKFLPAISELMAEVKAAKSEIGSALEFAARLPAVRADLARRER